MTDQPKRLVRWRPDTCECVVITDWDTKHSFEDICELHDHYPNDTLRFAAVREHNRNGTPTR